MGDIKRGGRPDTGHCFHSAQRAVPVLVPLQGGNALALSRCFVPHRCCERVTAIEEREPVLVLGLAGVWVGALVQLRVLRALRVFQSEPVTLRGCWTVA